MLCWADQVVKASEINVTNCLKSAKWLTCLIQWIKDIAPWYFMLESLVYCKGIVDKWGGLNIVLTALWLHFVRTGLEALMYISIIDSRQHNSSICAISVIGIGIGSFGDTGCLMWCQSHNCVRELRSLVQLQQNKITVLENEAAELKLLHSELKREVLLLKVWGKLVLRSSII